MEVVLQLEGKEDYVVVDDYSTEINQEEVGQLPEEEDEYFRETEFDLW